MIRCKTSARPIFSASLLLAVACGGEDGEGNDTDTTDTLEIVEFTRSPAGVVNTGDTLTLSWVVRGASNVQITQDPGPTAPIFDGPNLMGNVVTDAIQGPVRFELVASSDDGGMVSDSVELTSDDVDGISIVSFERASSGEIRNGDTVEFNYTLSGAVQLQEIGVRDDEGNVPEAPNGDPVDLSLNDLEGTFSLVAVVPENAMGETVQRTYTLSVTAGGVQVERETTIDISAAEPVIENFATTAEGGRTTYFAVPASQQTRDSQVEVTWRVRNTDTVQIFYDEQSCTGRPRPAGRSGCNDDPGFCEGTAACANVDLLAGQHTLRLEATGPTGAVTTDEFTIEVVPDLEVVDFTITPASFWEAAVDAQVSWEVNNASTVQLQRCNGTLGLWEDVPLDGVTAESFDVDNADFVVEATGGGDTQRFRLLSTIRDDQGNLVKPTQGDLQERECSNTAGPDPTFPETSVTAGFTEPEPNESRTMAAPAVTASAGDGDVFRGTLANVNDVDVFRLETNPGDQLMIFALEAGVAVDMVCANNSVQLQLFGADGTTPLTPRVDEPVHDEIVSPLLGDCPQLYGAQTGFETLMNMPGGTVYVEVSGKNFAGSKSYFLVLESNPPLGRALNIDNEIAVGIPSWSITDLRVFSMPYSQGGMNALAPFVATVAAVFPNHSGAFVTNSALVNRVGETNAAHLIPFDLELQYGLRAIPDFRSLVTGDFVFPAPINIGVTFPEEDLGYGSQSPQSGIMLAYTAIPNPTNTSTGTALHYTLSGNLDGGPIIPADAFPMGMTVTFQQPFDDPIFQTLNMGGMAVPAQLGYPNEDGPGDFDGITHFHDFVSMSKFVADGFEEPLQTLPDNISGTESFLWILEIRDAQGNGYDLEVSFDVTESP